MRFILIASIGLILLILSVQAQDKKPTKDNKKKGQALANKVRDILERTCYRCHGQNGSNEGGFGYALDFEKLLERKVKPNNAERSRLYRRMGVALDMPPDGEEPRPTQAEIDIVKQWIEAGAPIPAEPAVKPRPFVSLKDEYEAMQKYLRKVNRAERKFIRFFTLRHLHNMPNKKDSDLRIYQAALSKLINGLSWKSDIVKPEPADQANTVFAIDLRKLDWDRKSLWREILKIYPYGLKHDRYPDDRELNDLAEAVYERTESAVPVIRADWFIAIASRPPLYHILLQIPEHASELEHRLKVNVRKNFLDGEIARAGFNASGVSGHNRLVERHDALHGSYWKSYDFLSSVGFGNLFVFPLGPKFEGNPFQRQSFKHDGGEIIFNLPNGLQGYMLVDGKDKRIDEGPIQVVSDGKKISGTPAIVNGLSCMACHQHGMIRFEDQIRTGHILGGDPRDFLRRVYPEKKEMDQLLRKDEKRFMTALEEAMGKYLKVGKDKDLDITEFAEPVSAIAKWYISEEMTSMEASRELGLKDAKRLEGAISANRRLQEVGLYPLSQGKKIKREVWEHTEFFNSPYQEAAVQLKLGVPKTIR